MHTNFYGLSLSGFGDILPNFSFRPWGSKNRIEWNQLKKFMHVEVDSKCMHTNFGGCGLNRVGLKTLCKKRLMRS